MSSCISAFGDKSQEPTMEEILAVVGSRRPIWEQLCGFMREKYGLSGSLKHYGKSYGWMMWFRRGGRTLLALYPGVHSITAQFVLGPSQVDDALALPLGDRALGAIRDAHPYPEGRWLFMDNIDEQDALDLQRLVLFKSPPPRSRLRRA